MVVLILTWQAGLVHSTTVAPRLLHAYIMDQDGHVSPVALSTVHSMENLTLTNVSTSETRMGSVVIYELNATANETWSIKSFELYNVTYSNLNISVVFTLWGSPVTTYNFSYIVNVVPISAAPTNIGDVFALHKDVRMKQFLLTLGKSLKDVGKEYASTNNSALIAQGKIYEALREGLQHLIKYFPTWLLSSKVSSAVGVVADMYTASGGGGSGGGDGPCGPGVTPAQCRNGSLAEGIACEAAFTIFGAAFSAVTLGLVLLVGLAGAGVFGAHSYYT